jgi:uncharacterized protein YggE
MIGEARRSVDPGGRVTLAGRLIFLALALGWILRPTLSPAQMMEWEKRRTLTVVGRSERLIAPEVAWLILAAVAAGADRVEGLSFTSRQEAYRQELLEAAIRKAREEAEVLAKVLGVRIVRVLQATPNFIPSFPHRRPFFAEARPAWVPTPIEPEEVRVIAEATVTYEIE